MIFDILSDIGESENYILSILDGMDREAMFMFLNGKPENAEQVTDDNR